MIWKDKNCHWPNRGKEWPQRCPRPRCPDDQPQNTYNELYVRKIVSLPIEFQVLASLQMADIFFLLHYILPVASRVSKIVPILSGMLVPILQLFLFKADIRFI